jgi:aspartate carbamoyltransferase catalytic subunit
VSSAFSSDSSSGKPSPPVGVELLTPWPHAHLITSSDWDLVTVRTLLKTANHYFQTVFQTGSSSSCNPSDNHSVLTGHSVVNLFYEQSTRTRISFELAAKKLGATVINFEVSTSSVGKGESLEDTLSTLIAMGINAIVVRHASSGTPVLLHRQFGEAIHIINAGDGTHDHPTQGLLDLLTLFNAFELPLGTGTLQGKKVVIVGDILHSRVARSNLYFLNLLGATVHVVAPPALLPKNIEDLGCTAHHHLEKALQDADVVMGLRLQRERQSDQFVASLAEYTHFYGLTQDRLQRFCKPGVFIMHPGPVNRGVEMSSDLIDHPQSLITKQVRYGVAVRMAILSLCLSKPLTKS